MSLHLCEQCGAENAAYAQFCTKCDFYLGWDAGGGSLDGSPLTSEVPVVRQTHSQGFPAITLSPERPKRHHSPATARRPSTATRPAAAPKVTVEIPEITVEPESGGTVDVCIRNTSSIVDGYTVEAPNAPEWLEIEHPEIRLLTDEENVLTVTLRVRPRFDVYVQRFRLWVQICSVEDRSKRTNTELIVTVPRIGGPVTVTAEPQVVRLRDHTTGRFRVRLDNSRSNYPQRYALSGSDPERVVRFTFRPHIVEVPPRRIMFVDVRFDTPPLDFGQQGNHNLTISAASDQGAVEATVNVVQERSQAPPDSPVRLRLEPSVSRIRDRAAAEISVIVDNRRGSKDRRLIFSGRDPEARVRFAFSQPQLVIRAGEQARISGRIEAPLPRPGEEAERPFAVVCNDGTDESEATGSLIQAATASPITTAQIRLEPEHVVARNRRRGRFCVSVDNSRGMLPLTVWLSGSDPESAVRFRFTPARLEVPPGTLGRAALRVEADRPGSGQEVVREIKVQAGDGVGVVEAQGRFTQSMLEIMPILRLVFTLLGGLIAVLGAMRPWLPGGPTYYMDRLLQLESMVSLADNDAKWIAVSQPAGRALVVVLAAVMMLGILSARARVTILSGFLTGTVMIGYIVYAQSEFGSRGAAYGAMLVVFGAIIGIVGGLCIKRSGP
jgi:hypothetical protein